MRNLFTDYTDTVSSAFVQEDLYGTNTAITPSPRRKIERPSFRLHNWGTEYLEDAELLCILLPSPDSEQTHELAHRILSHFNYRFSDMAKASIYDLRQIKGVGTRIAQKIYTSFAISKRRQLEEVPLRTKITSSRDAYNCVAPLMMDLGHEEFWILMLNRANEVINRVKISQGGVSGTVVDSKIIFRKALENKACSIILSHCHPSGNCRPSQADLNITQKIKTAGITLDIAVLDHIIVAADNGFYSFADEGKL